MNPDFKNIVDFFLHFGKVVKIQTDRHIWLN